MNINSMEQILYISVVICTCNREDMLKKLLVAVSNLKIPGGLYFEVLVIDNNSTDNTATVVNNFSMPDSIHLRYIFETQQGLSYARNRGIQESKGDFIIFWDDDVIPCRDYLHLLKIGLEKLPNASAFGGKIIGIYPNKPNWFITEGPYKLRGILGSYDLGTDDHFLKESEEMPVGANMIFRKDVFGKIGVFRTDLGRRKGSKYILGGEETDLCLRIINAGLQIGYLADATVKHYVDTSRFSKKYLKKVFIGSGICLAFQPSSKDDIKMFLRIPRYLYRQYITIIFKEFINFLTNNFEASFYFTTRRWVLNGIILGLLKTKTSNIDFKIIKGHHSG